MASQIPDLLSDDPPSDLLTSSTHSEPIGGAAARSSSHTSAGRSTSSTRTPTASSSPSSSGFLSYPFSRVASSLTRRLTDPDGSGLGNSSGVGSSKAASRGSAADGNTGVFHPAKRRPAGAPSAAAAALFAPPPLTGLTLAGLPAGTRPGAQLLNTVLAEEIRLLLPPRLQLADAWRLAFSVERDGVSLSTLYGKCSEGESMRSSRGAGWVLVVRDGAGSVFGAFLTDAPSPGPAYYGTGECFLWRATVLPAALILQALPPPPSADTTHYAQRSTTLASPTTATGAGGGPLAALRAAAAADEDDTAAGARTPDQIRFKAFPYSGVNDYLIYCEHDYLSVGGGDGRYGLWLDSSLETGVSSACMTFGNEPLSDEGDKFEVLGVELWHVGG